MNFENALLSKSFLIPNRMVENSYHRSDYTITPPCDVINHVISETLIQVLLIVHCAPHCAHTPSGTPSNPPTTPHPQPPILSNQAERTCPKQRPIPAREIPSSTTHQNPMSPEMKRKKAIIKKQKKKAKKEKENLSASLSSSIESDDAQDSNKETHINMEEDLNEPLPPTIHLPGTSRSNDKLKNLVKLLQQDQDEGKQGTEEQGINQAKQRNNQPTYTPQKPPPSKSPFAYTLKTTKFKDEELKNPRKLQKYMEKFDTLKNIKEVRPIQQGQHYLLAFEEHKAMSDFLKAISAENRIIMEPTNNMKEKSERLVINNASQYTTDEDLKEHPEIQEASPLTTRYGKPTGKWVVTVTNKETRNRLLQNGIRIGYISYTTEPYLPAPRLLQCYHCQGFHHHQSKCKEKEEKCYRCSGTHRGQECTATGEELKCANCQGNHQSRSTICEIRREAVQQVINSSRSYADVLQLRHGGVTTPPPFQPNKPKTQQPPNSEIPPNKNVLQQNNYQQPSSSKQTPSMEQTTPNPSSKYPALQHLATMAAVQNIFQDIMTFMNKADFSIPSWWKLATETGPKILNLIEATMNSTDPNHG